MHYLKGLKWENITRDERYFCCELYYEIRKNPRSFVKWLNNNCNLAFSERNLKQNWEAANEVCFYRDIIKVLGFNGVHSIGKTKLSDVAKRTFDICLFSETHIVIVEAKAQQSFRTDQLTSIKSDKKKISDMFNGIRPKVIFIALFSSKYKPTAAALNCFDNKYIYWSQVGEKYNNTLLLKADGIYGK